MKAGRGTQRDSIFFDLHLLSISFISSIFHCESILIIFDDENPFGLELGFGWEALKLLVPEDLPT